MMKQTIPLLIHKTKVVCKLLSLILILHVLVSPSKILYTGRLYYVKKKVVGHWKIMYSVARDLEVLKQVYYSFILCDNNELLLVSPHVMRGRELSTLVVIVRSACPTLKFKL